MAAIQAMTPPKLVTHDAVVQSVVVTVIEALNHYIKSLHSKQKSPDRAARLPCEAALGGLELLVREAAHDSLHAGTPKLRRAGNSRSPALLARPWRTEN
jgi:hypothetical protein